MKYKKYSEREALHEIREVIRYPKDQMTRLKMDW